MGEALVKEVANFINGFFGKRCLLIRQYVPEQGFNKNCC